MIRKDYCKSPKCSKRFLKINLVLIYRLDRRTRQHQLSMTYSRWIETPVAAQKSSRHSNNNWPEKTDITFFFIEQLNTAS